MLIPNREASMSTHTDKHTHAHKHTNRHTQTHEHAHTHTNRHTHTNTQTSSSLTDTKRRTWLGLSPGLSPPLSNTHTPPIQCSSPSESIQGSIDIRYKGLLWQQDYEGRRAQRIQCCLHWPIRRPLTQLTGDV